MSSELSSQLVQSITNTEHQWEVISALCLDKRWIDNNDNDV